MKYAGGFSIFAKSMREKLLFGLNKDRNECVIVVGMHRSGTSATSGMINLLGYDYGKHKTSPNIHNPKGFFENKKIMQFNDLLLNSLGAKWDNTLNVNNNRLCQVNNHFEELMDILEYEFENQSCVLIKDPRLCSLLPLYMRVFRRMRWNTKFIISYRNPIEVAASLRNKWGTFPQKKALLLWMDHNLKAEFHTRHYKRIFVYYSDIIENPKEVLSSIKTNLMLNAEISSDLYSKISSFIEPSLKHHNYKQEKSKTEISKLSNQLFQLFLQARSSNISSRNLKHVDRIRNVFNKQL